MKKYDYFSRLNLHKAANSRSVVASLIFDWCECTSKKNYIMLFGNVHVAIIKILLSCKTFHFSSVDVRKKEREKERKRERESLGNWIFGGILNVIFECAWDLFYPRIRLPEIPSFGQVTIYI